MEPLLPVSISKGEAKENIVREAAAYVIQY